MKLACSLVCLQSGAAALQPAAQGLHLQDARLRIYRRAGQRRLRQGDVPQQGQRAHAAPLRPAAIRHHPLAGSEPWLHSQAAGGEPTLIVTCDLWLLTVRDAAARLPNGEGTRAEICELLKDSQFLAPDVTSAQVGSW